MKKQTIDHIFIVLVYRNTDDLVEFIQSASSKVSSYRVVVVNSYYDDASRDAFKSIAEEYSCDFINIENKGYGYGNNVGIKYAMENFNFKYLIVSNPDIELKEFSTASLDAYSEGLIGPLIKTSNCKDQNPYWAIRNTVCEWLIYQGYKRKSRVFVLMGTAINRLIREVFLFTFRLSSKRLAKVYALHGSFVIFPYALLSKIGLPYDEKIFLFSEEADLAHELRAKGFKSYVAKDVSVLHKEDGSMNVAKIDEKSELRKSYMYQYQKNQKKRD